MLSRHFRTVLVFLASGCFIGSQVLAQTALVQAQPHTQNTATRTPTWRGWPSEPGASDQYPTALEACRSIAIYLRNRPADGGVTVIPKRFNDYGSPTSVDCAYEGGGGDSPVEVNCGPWSFDDVLYGPYQYLGDANSGICVHSTIVGNGKNVIVGSGSGNDVLEGTSGNDVFIFIEGQGFDTINNFDRRFDELILSNYKSQPYYADTDPVNVFQGNTEIFIDGLPIGSVTGIEPDNLQPSVSRY